MNIGDHIGNELLALERDLLALRAGISRAQPIPVLSILLTRLKDFRADLKAEFPRLLEVHK